MNETQEPRSLETPAVAKRRKVRVSDIIIFALLIVLIVAMVLFIVNRLHLKHEIDGATAVSNAVVADLAKQNTAGLRALGDKQFQSKNSAATLDAHLTATDQDGTKITFAQLYGDTTPTVDRRIVVNNSRGQHVATIYRYNKLKAPLFVRVDNAKLSGSSKWTLQALGVSPNESSLLTP